jgi:hypothetical protein
MEFSTPSPVAGGDPVARPEQVAATGDQPQAEIEPKASEGAEELKTRIDAMGEWAAKTQSQIRGLASGLKILEDRTAGLEILQESMDVIASQIAQGHHSDHADRVDGAVGYQPTPDQQALLFAALADWQVSAAPLEKGQTANIETRNGGKVSYRYADIAAVSEIARSAGSHGLAHFHREIVLNGQSFIRTYLLHKGGGWISCDVPLLIKENTLISSLQQWAGASTMARRYGLFMVLGIAAAEDDDDGASAGNRSRNLPPAAAASQGTAPRPAQARTTTR